MPSNRRKQFNPTKSVNIIEKDDKPGTSSGSYEIEYREVVLKMGRGVGYLIKNYIFIKNREFRGKVFLRCQQRTSCSARAYIHVSTNKAVVTQSYHAHPPPNNRTIEFKTPEKKECQSPSRVSPRKAAAALLGKSSLAKASAIKASPRKPSPRKRLDLKSEKKSQDDSSSEDPSRKPGPPARREKSQRTRKVPVKLREDPSPIPHMPKRRKKKKVVLVAPPKKKKKVTPVRNIKLEPIVIFGDDIIKSEVTKRSSDSEQEEMDDSDASDGSPSSSRSPSRSPRGKQGSSGSAGSSPKCGDLTAEFLRKLTNETLDDSDLEEDDDLIVSSDDDNPKPKVLDKKELKQQRTILDVDQLRKLSATALVLKFSRHTTCKVPKDLETFTYQHQYACTMLPGICSEKFCGNAIDTKPQIKRHLLRHIGELLTMTNQLSPATVFPGSIQSQAKRGMPTTEEIEMLEEVDNRPSSPTAKTSFSQDTNNSARTSGSRPASEDKSVPINTETKSFMVSSTHQPNKSVPVVLPKMVDVRRSGFTVIRSAEGVNEVVLLPKGRLINLSKHAQDDDQKEEDKDKKDDQYVNVQFKNEDNDQNKDEDKEQNHDEDNDQMKDEDIKDKDEEQNNENNEDNQIKVKDKDITDKDEKEDNTENHDTDNEDEKDQNKDADNKQDKDHVNINDDVMDDNDTKDNRDVTKDNWDVSKDDMDVTKDNRDVTKDDRDGNNEDDQNRDDEHHEDDYEDNIKFYKSEIKQGEKKLRPYYPKRKKGMSKTRAFQMRQSAIRLEIIDNYDEDIDIEATGDDGREATEEKIETEEVSLSGAFQSPDNKIELAARKGIPSTSQEIECDIIIRTRKYNANKKSMLPKFVGQSVKSSDQLSYMSAIENLNRIAMDPPGDDHNYAWHPTRYITGPTHTDSSGCTIETPEDTDDTFELDSIFQPNQSSGRIREMKQKRFKKRKSVVKTIRGVGKVVSVPKSPTISDASSKWVKVPARGKKEPTDEEKKMKKKALELLNALHRKQPLKGRKGPFKCQLCGKNVTAAGTLRAHYRSHAGIKPYRCKLCGATFTRLHSLKYHMMIHNQQCRFVCDHCSREFRHASHFREHLRRHTGEEPFGCTDCTARFKTRNTYKRHLFAKHGKLLTSDGIELIPHAT